MHILPADIQLLIVEHIVLKSDLKALCSTSKACRVCALPRLYFHIELVSWYHSDEHFLCFFACVAAGASQHLRFTRHLTIEGSRPPSEPALQQAGLWRHDARPHTVEGHLMDREPHSHDKVGAYIVAILAMLSRNKLLSFQ